MTGAQRERLNGFFVGTFNNILALEERALAGPGDGAFRPGDPRDRGGGGACEKRGAEYHELRWRRR